MGKSKAIKLPRSVGKLVKFFDTHDMGDFIEEMPESKFDVDLKKRTHLFSLDAEIEKKLTKVAKSKHVSSEKLINAWLKEKLSELGKKSKERRPTTHGMA